jgi:hypothetical protein
VYTCTVAVVDLTMGIKVGSVPVPATATTYMVKVSDVTSVPNKIQVRNPGPRGAHIHSTSSRAGPARTCNSQRVILCLRRPPPPFIVCRVRQVRELPAAYSGAGISIVAGAAGTDTIVGGLVLLFGSAGGHTLGTEWTVTASTTAFTVTTLPTYKCVSPLGARAGWRLRFATVQRHSVSAWVSSGNVLSSVFTAT